MPPPIRARSVLLAVVIAAGLLLGLSGCADAESTQSRQKLPWTRPANWENTMPGMNTTAPKY